MRKFLSLLLALVMVLCCIPAVAETEDGCENLSAAIPRTVEDIEAVMRKG